MQTVHSGSNFWYYPGSVALVEHPTLLQFTVKSALIHILQHEIEIGCVVEEAIHLHYVFVPYCALHTELECELCFHHVCLDHFLCDFLNGEYSPCCLVNRLVHCPEFALSEFATQCKVGYARIIPVNFVWNWFGNLLQSIRSRRFIACWPLFPRVGHLWVTVIESLFICNFLKFRRVELVWN